MTRPVSVQFALNGIGRSLWINPGMPEEELRSTLSAAFGLEDEDLVQGLYVSDTGRQFSLDKVCAAPSLFAGYRGISLVLTADKDPQAQSPVPVVQSTELTTNLGDALALTSADVTALVARAAQVAPQGNLNRRTFNQLMLSHMSAKGRSSAAIEPHLEKLFELFDRDSNGIVDTKELLSGLTVLSSGDRDDKIRVAFDLYDADRNGFINLSEMKQYLTSVFNVIRESNPDVFERHQVSPEELGAITAEQCFEEADVDQDGQLSFDEFRRWYTEANNKKRSDFNDMVATFQDKVAAQSKQSLLELSKELGFDQFKSEQVFDVFAEYSSNGSLSRAEFKKAYAALFKATSSSRFSHKLDELFNWFDQNNDGAVDFEELGSALSVLCGGSRDDKVRAAFALYDYNNDGYITIDEATHYMTSVFTLMYQANPSVHSSVGGVDPAELAELTAKQCFREADLDGDGKLTFEDFKRWYTSNSNPAVETTTLVQAPPPPRELSLHEMDIDLNKVRELTGVDRADIFAIFDRFADNVDDDGFLSWSAFQASFDDVLAFTGVYHSAPRQRAMYEAVVARLFSLFDADHNGKVDFTELASGLGVLTRNTGAPDDKIRATFSLFDTNGDGFIDRSEMDRYLTSLYRVMFDVSGSAIAHAGGLDPRSLAKVTTDACFDEADLNGDGRLSFAEFTKWFLADDTGLSLAMTVPPPAVAAGPSATRPLSGLEELKRLTGLGSLEVDEVFHLLGSSVDPDKGGLSRPVFLRLFSSIAPKESKQGESAGRLTLVLNGLFDAFDADSNGLCSFAELTSGLSVLCEGDPNEKAEAAFTVFDLNGDDEISLEEMTLYMKSVFRVLWVADPSARARAGDMSPDQLAMVTAQSIFEKADLNKDGKLSFEEFKSWYQGRGAPGSLDEEYRPMSARERAAAEEMAANASWLSLQEVRRLTTLESYSASEAFEELAEVADKNGLIDKSSFFRAFHRLVARKGGIDAEDEEERDRLRFVLHRLFDAFDLDRNGYVDFAELSSGLSILCGGDPDERARSAFSLYDVNGDGRISKDEMLRYLTCVIKVMYEIQPGTQERAGLVSAEELAEATTAAVFEDADADKDGSLDFEEFRKWYAKDTGKKLSVAADIMAADPEWFNLEEIRRLTLVGVFSSDELLRLFADVAREDEDVLRDDSVQARLRKRSSTSGMVISREAFQDVWQNELVDPNGCATEDDYVRLTFILDRLYDMFDINGDGRVDFSELSSGLSVLCGGSKAEKAGSVFELFDEDGDGSIDLGEMQRYLASVYKVLFSTRPEVRKSMAGISPEQLAIVTAEQCFVEADLNGDGHLSLEEFTRWINREPAGKAFQDILSSAPAFVDMNEVRKLTMIHQFTPEDVRDQIDSFADDDGNVSVENFVAAFREAVAEVNPGAVRDGPTAARLNAVLHRLFRVFDADSNGLVDRKELTAGLSILCGGDRDSKAEIAFEAFDLDGNGRISLSEMTRYLSSVFRIMYETKPDKAAAIGASPEQLAKATADQIFVDADLDENGELDFDEFKKWYTGSSEGAALAEATSAAEHNLDLASIRKLTRLDQFVPTEVFETFARHATDGELSRRSFEMAFREVAAHAAGPALSPQDMDKLHFVVGRLFDAFNTNSNDKVEFMDLVAGLSVLCGGSKQMRAESAFALYDYDGDGAIQESEMRSYLTGVFRVMFELVPSSKSRFDAAGGITPEALAEVTTKQIFLECDLNRDGELSFPEFSRWFEENGKGGLSSSSSSKSDDTDHMVQRAHSFDSASPKLILEDARRLTGLASIDASEAFEQFAQLANSSGELIKEDFVGVFAKIIGARAHLMSQAELNHSADIVLQLFHLFDQNGDGRIDFIELASGLSVLCGGGSDAKAEAVFRLYDREGTGFVDQQSMEWYLASVYRLMYKARPETVQVMDGMSPEELARITASQIFQEADSNKDGAISFREFREWYSREENQNSGSVGSSVMKLVQAAPTLLSLDDLKRITGLANVSQRDVFEDFAEAVDDDGMLGPAEFRQVFMKIISSSKRALSEDDARLVPLVLERLFDLFDTNKDSRVDFAELAAGLSILCNDEATAKAEAAFALFDENDDGRIDIGELERYLASVYRIMFSSNPEISEEMQGLTPDELAEATSSQIFEDMVEPGEDSISFEAFKRWFNEEGGAGMFPTSVPKRQSSADANQNQNQNQNLPPRRGVIMAVPVVDRETSPEWLSIQEVSRITGFGSRDVHEVFEEFAKFTNEEGVLNQAAFDAAFNAAAAHHSPRLSPSDRDKLALIRARLFHIFDLDGNGVVDFAEISSGLSVLCNGSGNRKASAAFQLYDINQDGFISFDEMARYLVCVFRILFETDPSAARRAGTASPEQLALATTKHIFGEADLNGDGKLSLDEFSRWYEASSAPEKEQAAVESSSNRRSADNISIEEARRITGLGDLPAETVFQEFALVTDEEGMLNKSNFTNTIRTIVSRTRPSMNGEDRETLELVLERLYRVFDTNGDGKIDFSELCSGLSILTRGEREDKVRSAFALYDIDNDGVITMEEMESYLTSLFRVLFELMPSTRDRVDVSPEDLALATTEQCFEEADTNKDGRLSFDEFNQWFASGGGDFFGSSSTPQQLPLARESSTASSSASSSSQQDNGPMGGLAEIKRLTKLGNLTVNEVLGSVRATAGDGDLNYEKFVAVFEALISQGGGYESYADQHKATAVIRQLFSLFDRNNDGTIDSRELSSGLSVLCKGTRDEKVDTAFQLYDLNNDGFISLEEMCSYLSSVFKVLYAAQPETAKTFGVSAETLGLVTAEQCFLEADSNKDGKLSREEFKAWYSKNAP